MIDTPKEAATGDKAARDLMISEKKYIIGANRAGKSTFFTHIQNVFEIQKKEIKKLQTELIKERAVNAKLLEALKAANDLHKVGLLRAEFGQIERVNTLRENAIKQAEEL
jgi:ABC-type phosphate/phosphonate transport system ATPase subunit